jgi:hypothetical protein
MKDINLHLNSKVKDFKDKSKGVNIEEPCNQNIIKQRSLNEMEKMIHCLQEILNEISTLIFLKPHWENKTVR